VKRLEYLLVDDSQEFLRISLNRPEKRNALNPGLLEELRILLAHHQDLLVNEKSKIRAVFLSGEGSSFCAGADLDYMKRIAQLSEAENMQDASLMHDTFMAIKNFPVPVVSFVHGNCFAGGLGLLGASDIAVAHEDSRFCFTEVKLGLVPAIIADFILQKVSAQRLAPAIFLAEVFTAQEALGMGLIHKIYSGSRREQILSEWMDHFCKVSFEAVLQTKALILDLEKTKEPLSRKRIVTQAIAKARASKEGQEGIASFLEKRDPAWLKIR
jgi:methylglutaconyl-CoA hydratase